MSSKHNIKIPFPQPGPPSDAQYKFAYKKPTAMHLIGSYALKAVSRSRQQFNVDVAVEMPSVSVNINLIYRMLCHVLTYLCSHYFKRRIT